MRSEDIRNLVVIGESRSLMAAAQSIGISQPTLSKSVARIERALGAPVIQRLARGVVLTEAGRVFLEYARPVALSLQDAIEAVRDLRHGRLGTVRLGVGVGVPQALIIEACRPVVASTRLSIEITGGMSDTLSKAVASGQCDFAVISIPPQDLSSMRWEPLFRDPMVPIVATGHPLGRVRAVDWETLSKLTWVVPGVGTPVRAWFESQFTDRHFPVPDHVISMRDYFAQPDFGAALGAVSLMPASFNRLRAHTRAYRELATPSDWLSERVVGVLCRRAGYVSPAAERLVTSIVQTGGKLFGLDPRHMLP